ncbi:hypothetical protein [Sphingomonas hylomeconis]|uniref:Uncharacterized protein n=1 Tax=Sphingomonas hylomeconis TaxID=1395958 RepID=A0ABV7SQ59_9SPHN|nr:hypothetical protein [Sphingomonas hylomeconis]
MATQFADIAPCSFPLAAPKPNIKIAYIAGPAAVAVGAAISKLPEQKQGATLEDLACISDTAALTSWDLACEALENAVQSRDEFQDTILVPLDAMLKSVKDAGHDTTALNAYYAERSATYDVLVGAVSAATTALATTPAPDAAGLAYKVRALAADEFHLNTADNTPLVEAIDADAKAVLDRATERNPFMRGPLIQWQRSYSRYVEALKEARTYYDTVLTPADDRFQAVRDKWPLHYHTGNDPIAKRELAEVDYTDIEKNSDQLWNQATDARVELYLAPAPSTAELGVKLKIFAENDDHDLTRARDIIRQMVHDARRFGRMGSHPIGDEALNDAFAGLRKEMLAYRARPEDTSVEADQAADLRVDALEDVVYKARAATLEGVLVKLRVAFQHKELSPWSDLAMGDPTNQEFVRGLYLADMFDQVLWSAIEDLARIAGVNLAEQGA